MQNDMIATRELQYMMDPTGPFGDAFAAADEYETEAVKARAPIATQGADVQLPPTPQPATGPGGAGLEGSDFSEIDDYKYDQYINGAPGANDPVPPWEWRQGKRSMARHLIDTPESEEVDPVMQELMSAEEQRKHAIAQDLAAYNAQEYEELISREELSIEQANQIEQLHAMGMPVEGIKEELGLGSAGLKQRVSFPEFYASGLAASGMIAGAPGALTFAIGAPIEYAGMMAFEELGEDHPFIGIAGEIAFGVLTGTAVHQILTKRVFSSSSKALNRAIDKKVLDIIDEPGFHEQITGISPARRRHKRLHAESMKQSVSTDRLLNVGRRKAVTAAEHLKAKAIKGDLRDPEVRELYAETAANIKAQPDVTPEESTFADHLSRKVSRAAEENMVMKPQGDAPAMESINPVASTRVSEHVRAAVHQEWFGDSLDAAYYKAAAQKSGKPISDTQAKKIAQGKRDTLAKWGFMPDEMRADFVEDVREETKTLIAEGMSRKEASAKALEDMRAEYAKGVNEAVPVKLSLLDKEALTGIKKSSVRGGTRAIDDQAQFIVPPGRIGSRTGDPSGDMATVGASRYKHYDWDITQFLEIAPKSSRVRLLPEIPARAPKPTNDNVSARFPYASHVTESDAELSAKKFIDFWKSEDRIKWKKVKGKNRWEVEKANQYKTQQEYYDKKAQGFDKMPQHREDEVEALARWLGWDESKVTDVTSVTKGGDAYTSIPEDIIKGKDTFQSFNVMDPGKPKKGILPERLSYIQRQNRLPAEEREAKFVAASIAKDQYNGQREDFIRRVLGIPENAPSYKFYQAMDKHVAMRNELVDEIKHLTGSPQEAQAKMMYMRVGDKLAGTSNVQALKTMTRAQVRKAAWDDIAEFQGGKLSQGDLQSEIESIMTRNGVEYDEAVRMYQDAEQAAEIGAARASEVLDTPGHIIEPQIADDTIETIRFTDLMQDDQIRIAKQAAQIEDHIGSRVADSVYRPGALGAHGRVNVLKINEPADIDRIFKTFDQPAVAVNKWDFSSGGTREYYKGTVGEALLDDLDPMATIGLKAHEGHSQDMVNRLTYILNDTQAQMGQLSEQLTKHPDDILTAVAFEKMRAINGILTSQLTDGVPSKASLKSLQRMDFTALDDASLVDRMAKVVDDNYAIYKATDADTRATVEFAKMYNDMPTAQQRGRFLRAAADVDDYSGLSAGRQRMIAMRKAISKKISERCD